MTFVFSLQVLAGIEQSAKGKFLSWFIQVDEWCVGVVCLLKEREIKEEELSLWLSWMWLFLSICICVFLSVLASFLLVELQSVCFFSIADLPCIHNGPFSCPLYFILWPFASGCG